MTKIVALTVGSFLNVVRLSGHDVTFAFINAIACKNDVIGVTY